MDRVIAVSSPEAAELTKLLENIFRSVNIALVNELAQLCDRMRVDVWEVVDAAATKPFGFMSFKPGPGLGGHCLPVDPFYLSWKARELVFYRVHRARREGEREHAVLLPGEDHAGAQLGGEVGQGQHRPPRRRLLQGRRRRPAGVARPEARRDSAGRGRERLLPRSTHSDAARVRARVGVAGRAGGRRLCASSPPLRDRLRRPGGTGAGSWYELRNAAAPTRQPRRPHRQRDDGGRAGVDAQNFRGSPRLAWYCDATKDVMAAARSARATRTTSNGCSPTTRSGGYDHGQAYGTPTRRADRTPSLRQARLRRRPMALAATMPRAHRPGRSIGACSCRPPSALPARIVELRSRRLRRTRPFWSTEASRSSAPMRPDENALWSLGAPTSGSSSSSARSKIKLVRAASRFSADRGRRLLLPRFPCETAHMHLLLARPAQDPGA